MSKLSQDAKDARAIIAGIKAGEIETYPDDVVNQIICGENPVRVFRVFRNLTTEQLADKAGIALQQLRKIEAGDRPARSNELKRIGGVLNIDVDLLVSAPE